MIMIFHSDIPILYNNLIYQNLHIGVDCFLFLSGLGIAQSLNKNNNKKEFYKKRILRILPTTIPLIIIFSYLLLIMDTNFDGKNFYLLITNTNFLLAKGNNPLFMWYIPCILIYYLISPFLFSFLKSNEFNLKLIFKIMILILISYIIPAGTEIITIRNIFSRFPVYFLGMVYRMRYIVKKDISKKEIIITIFLAILSVIGIYFFNHFYRTYLNQFIYLCYIPIVLIIVYTVTYLVEKIKLKYTLLKEIGKSTLAIYCSHEFIKLISLGAINKYNLWDIVKYNSYIYSIIFAIIGLVFGIIWTHFNNYIYDNKPKKAE